jgi:hypothetical protein
MQTSLWIFRNRAKVNIKSHSDMFFDFPGSFAWGICGINHHLVNFFVRKPWVHVVAEGKSGITDHNRCCGLCPRWLPGKGWNSRERKRLSPPQESYSHQARVVHVCNPSYSGGRDQEDHGLKPAQVNSSWDLVTKKIIRRKRQGIGP